MDDLILKIQKGIQEEITDGKTITTLVKKGEFNRVYGTPNPKIHEDVGVESIVVLPNLGDYYVPSEKFLKLPLPIRKAYLFSLYLFYKAVKKSQKIFK